MKLIIEQCEKLTSIIDLSYFDGINEYEQAMMRQYVVDHNYNVRFEEVVTEVNLEDANFLNYKLKDKYPAFDNSVEWELG